jgi:hypothetical protein
MAILDPSRPTVRAIPHVGQRGAASVLAFRRDPLAFLRRGLNECGDVYRFRLLGVPIVFVNYPDLIQQVLVEGGESYDKEWSPVEQTTTPCSSTPRTPV